MIVNYQSVFAHKDIFIHNRIFFVLSLSREGFFLSYLFFSPRYSWFGQCIVIQPTPKAQ